MPDQSEVDTVWREFTGSREFQLADRQTQAALSAKFQSQVGTPSALKSGVLKGLASGLFGGLADIGETVAETRGAEPPLTVQGFRGLSESLKGPAGFTGAGRVAASIAEEVPEFALAGGVTKLGLKGLASVAASSLPKISSILSSVAKADKLLSSTAREAATGYVYGELADKNPLAEATTFGVLNVGLRGAGSIVGRAWRTFRKTPVKPIAEPAGAPAGPPAPPTADDIVTGSSSADVVRKARERLLERATEPAPPPPPTPSPPARRVPPTIRSATDAIYSARFEAPESTLTSMRERASAIRALENPYLSEAEKQALPLPEPRPDLTDTIDGLATLQRLRNARQLRREAIARGFPEDVVSEASNASLWEAVSRNAKPEELMVVHGPPKPVLVPKIEPAPATGGITVNFGEESFSVRLPGLGGMDVAGVAADGASLARAEAAPGVRSLLDGLDAIREIDEALLSPIEADAAWAAARGPVEIEALAAKGMKFFSGKIRSRALARSFTASEEIFNRAGKHGRDFRERAGQAHDTAVFVESRAVGSTGLFDRLKAVKRKNWDSFVDAYQMNTAPTDPEAVETTRRVMDSLAEIFEENGVMTRRWDREKGGWTKVAFQRLRNFLPAVPDEKAIAAKLKSPEELNRLGKKYDMATEEVEEILSKMVTKDPATGTAQVDFISRRFNPQGAEMYRDWGLLTDMSVAIPQYIRSRSKALGLLRAFGGLEPAQVKQLAAAARAGDAQAEVALQARSALPLVSSLKQKILSEGGDEVLVETAANALLGRSNMVEGDKLLMRAVAVWQTLKLGKTAILNASELSLLADRFGTGETLKEIGTVARKALTGNGRMFDTRAWDEALIAYGEAARDTFGMSPEKFSRWYLKWTGFTATDIGGRAVALKLGRKWIERTAELAKQGDKQALRELGDLGVNLERLKTTGSLSQFDVSRATYRLSENLIPVSRADKLPPGWRDSLFGRLLSMFQSWGFQHSKRMKRIMTTDPKAGLRSLAYFVPSTYAVLTLRRKLSAVGTDREIPLFPEKATDVLFDLPLMTSIFGMYGNALLVLHPSGDFQARRTLEGPVFGSLFSLLQASRAIGQFMESDDPDAAKVMLATAKFTEREMSGVPGAGFLTGPLVKSLKPSPLERKARLKGIGK